MTRRNYASFEMNENNLKDFNLSSTRLDQAKRMYQTYCAICTFPKYSLSVPVGILYSCVTGNL